MSTASFLYHASPDKSLAVIEPKRTLSKDKYIGDYVFATEDPRLAAMYLASKGTALLMNVKSSPFSIVINANEQDYLASDKGGAVYKVPAATFEKTPQAGLEDSERISKVSTMPLEKKVYSSSIEAIQEAGVKIYFVDSKTFTNLLNNPDQDKIIASLKPYNL